MSTSADSTVNTIEGLWEETYGKMGMASKLEFVKWNTKKESAMQKTVRTTCDLLGPRRDQKSGYLAEWISYLAGKSLS